MKFFFYKLQLLLSLIASSIFAQGAVFEKKIGKSFSFQINERSRTSAGVYTNAGVLIRTLWSGVFYEKGSHTGYWDGYNDDGKQVNEASYQVRVLSGRLKIVWEGVIGNTSTYYTGETVHRALNPIESITFHKHMIYYCTGYNEQNSSTFKFNSKDPNKKSVILQKGLSVFFNVADNDNVYWCGKDASSKRFLVYATSAKSDLEVVFRDGQVFKGKYGRTYKSTIDLSTKSIDTVSGLAVQKNGNFLFVSHKSLNEIHVFNKTTGTLLSRIAIEKPEAILCDGSKFIWLISSDIGRAALAKYSISSDGKTLSPVLNIHGLQRPLAMALSPQDNYLLVGDGGNSQQLKAFDVTFGTRKWLFGQEGGYQTNPDVKDDKFYFSDSKGVSGSSFAFEDDGSFWILDKGNFRLQHFSKSRSIINSVMFLPMTYSISLDANDKTRLFCGYQEFKIDYSKLLRPGNGSWILLKNWGGNVEAFYDNKYSRLSCVTTLKNSRTIGLLKAIHDGPYSVVELPKSGNMHSTGVLISKEWRLCKDGSLIKRSKGEDGKSVEWLQRSLLGFDKNKPNWGDEIRLANLNQISLSDPISRANLGGAALPEMTEKGILVSFNPDKSSFAGTNWHLGGIMKGTSDWVWRTAGGTPTSYRGEYPADGTFDNGNSVRGAGSIALVCDRLIVWGYHGEFWKASQVNKWNIISDDGLFIDQFGVTGPEVKSMVAAAGMAGNVISAAITRVENGKMYLYHNDENYHSGIHRWSITGSESVKEQYIEIKLNKSTSDFTAKFSKPGNSSSIDVDLLNDLPYNQVLIGQEHGWSRYPVGEDSTNKYKKWWSVASGLQTYDRRVPPDLSIQYKQSSGDYSVCRILQDTMKAVKAWDIEVEFNMAGSNGTFELASKPSKGGGFYFDVLDDQYKSVINLAFKFNQSDGMGRLYANEKVVFECPKSELINLFRRFMTLHLRAKDGMIQVGYGASNTSIVLGKFSKGIWKRPKVFKIAFWSRGTLTSQIIDIRKFKFGKKVE